MHDILEVLPYGMHCFIYADDIFILVEAPTVPMVKNKIEASVSKLETLCKEWHLNIAPLKSGYQDNKKTKCNQGFGVSQIGSKSCPSSQDLQCQYHPGFKIRTIGMNTKAGLSRLQTLQNNVLLFVFGLPRWTPIPVLHKILNDTNIPLRFDKRNISFFFKQFSAHETTAVSKSIVETDRAISNWRYDRLPCGATLDMYTRLINLSLSDLIQIYIPESWEDHHNFVIRTDELECQQRDFDPGVIRRLYYEYRCSLHSEVVILATDASKNATGAATSAVNCSLPTKLQGSIPTVNSVFTGEALAMVLAISNYVREFKDYILLTYSMSNLTTLKNLNFQSPKSSLFLAKTIAKALNKCKSLELVYSPAHVGIRENEWADSVARDAQVSPQIYNFVSPEDAISACFKIIRLAQTEEWGKSKYCNKYTWLREFNYKKINFSRSSEVLIFRFLSRSLPLNTILYKCRLIDSPNCAVCQTPETWKHFVLICPQFENARDSLRSNLGCIPLSLDWISDFSFCGRLKSRDICAFLVSSSRF
ncbi:hypothetical protein AVEN_111633-1 [Araneus ventricosus]|uniref:Uncharacterized protein n=1 Tax=Araneus ventricosus TaxID=182803 RepID=A0A4Y2C5C8_ARAVE|nr:hypothetical protein AVEN_111633-1 [Araneus ventricosus]